MALNLNEKIQMFQLAIKAKVDCRTTAFLARVSGTAQQVTITGYTQFRQTDAFLKALAKEIFAGADITFQVKVLEKLAPKFAVVTDEFAPIWRKPDSSDPELLDTQAVYGTVLRAFFKDGDYTFAQHPDGYVGYLPTHQLKQVSVEEYLRWKNGPHVVTLAPVKAGGISIPPGSRLTRTEGKVILADGSPIRLAKNDYVAFDPSRSNFIAALKKRAEQFMDSPYLWGGKTEAGIDCSGFVQTLALQEGIFLPRDASMQCHVGEMVGYLPNYADLLPGDIMFFMNEKAFVFHVGIYLGDHKYMHSAGKTGPTVSSVYPKGENYMDRYGTKFVYARRIHR